MKCKQLLFFLLLYWADWLPGYAQAHHALIIHEMMADPTPVVQLPPYEWIEIKNNSAAPLQLMNWKLIAGTSSSSAFASYVLPPDSLLIICSTTAAASLKNFGPAMGLSSFPAISNDGETLSLRAPNGKTIHSVTFSTQWYGPSWKQDGGWSLEMTNATDPCYISNNWAASLHEKGGTPGQSNSKNTSSTVSFPSIQPLWAFAADAKTITIVMNRPVDSSMAVNQTLYQLSGSNHIESVRVAPPSYTQVSLSLSTPLWPDSLLTLTLYEVPDCATKKMMGTMSQKVGLASLAHQTSIVINEILFNPRPFAEDFVELYNRSQQLIDLSTIFITNRNSAGQLGSAYKICEYPFPLLPGQWVALTIDTTSLQREYLVPSVARLLQVKQLPLLPDDEGTVVLLNSNGTIIDEVHYYESWHYGLLQSREGVSLERRDPAGSAASATNWHSAASTEGFATPGRKNSQQVENSITTAHYEMKPSVFSPDSDGWEDYCQLIYKNENPGQLASIHIVDASGRRIKRLASQVLLGTTGYFNWDGNDERGQLCAPGNYLVVIEQFDLQGHVLTTRVPVVLTYQFRKV
jgi:hypothetical protein